MSLTREEWLEMWEAAKRLEAALINNEIICSCQHCKKRDNYGLKIIKDKIQQVVGQLE